MHQDNKLISANPSCNVLIPELLLKQRSKCAKYFIPDCVTAGIIDFFKMIHIQDQKSMYLVFSTILYHFINQGLRKFFVIQSGQCVFLSRLYKLHIFLSIF